MWLVWVAAAACQATLLTYGPPSALQPTGLGTAGVGGRGGMQGGLGGRLLAPPRLAGLLAGSRFSVLFGHFAWAGRQAAFNVLVVDGQTGLVQPLPGPSVWGAGVEGAVWRRAETGSFFVVGQLNGLDISPQSRLQGVAVCSLQRGCGAVSLGLSQLPQSLRVVSVAYQRQTASLYVMYRGTTLATSQLTGEETVVTLLGIFSDNTWNYFSLFRDQHFSNEPLRVLSVGTTVLVNLPPTRRPDRFLANAFCPEDNSPTPSILYTSDPEALCWQRLKSAGSLNRTFAASTQSDLYALEQNSGRVFKLPLGPSGPHMAQDITENLDTLRDFPAQKTMLVTSDHRLFCIIYKEDALFVALFVEEKSSWILIVIVDEPTCFSPDSEDESVYATNPPVMATPDGSKLVWTCPLVSNTRTVGNFTVKVFSFDVPVSFPETMSAQKFVASAEPRLIASTPLYVAAALDDMCAADSSVWMRGNFAAIDVKGTHVSAQSGLVMWYPTTNRWVETSTGFASASNIFSRCTSVDESRDLWVPFARDWSSFSLGFYDGSRDRWTFFHPKSPNPDIFAAFNASLAPDGHSSVLIRDGSAWMTWRLIRNDRGWTFGALVKAPISASASASSRWSVVHIFQGDEQSLHQASAMKSSCWDANTCWADNFAATLEFSGDIWVTGSFAFDSFGHGAETMRAVARFDPVTGKSLPVESSEDEYVFVTASAVGHYDTDVANALWVGGTIKTLPESSNLGSAMNVASLDKNGNYSATTKELLSPPARLNVQQLFFIGDRDDQAMVVISRDWRKGYELISSGMNVFRNKQTYPDPSVQIMWTAVNNAVQIKVDTRVSLWAPVVVVLVTILLITGVSILIPIVWHRFGGRGFRYISLPSYQDHGVDTNLGALLNDESIRKLDPADVEMGSKLGEGGQGAVYRARYLGREIACKLLLGFEATQFSRFVREIKLTSSIVHKNIVAFVGVILEDNGLYLCTEYLDTDLAHVIPVLTVAQQIQVTKNVASGMAYLHSFSPPVLHRDLK